jgi:hypothetical protein
MKTILRFFSVAGFAFAAFTTQAGTIEYPAGNPLFQLELPEGWTSSSDKDGNLDVKANDKSDFEFSIIPAPPGTEQDVKAFLPELAKTMGKEVQGFEADEIRNVTSPTGMKVLVLAAKGKMEDLEMIITLAAFAPVKDKYFIIMSMAEVGVDQAHDKAMGRIVKSIKAIE